MENIPVKIYYTHIGGKLGKLMMETFIKKKWIEKDKTSEKHFLLTPREQKELSKTLGLRSCKNLRL